MPRSVGSTLLKIGGYSATRNSTKNSRYHQLQPPRFAGPMFIATPPLECLCSQTEKPHGHAAMRSSGRSGELNRLFLEFESDADGRIHVVGTIDIAIGQTVMHHAVHDASVGIEAFGDPIIGIERDCVKASAAGSGHVAGAARVGAATVAVLVIAVVSPSQV